MPAASLNSVLDHGVALVGAGATLLLELELLREHLPGLAQSLENAQAMEPPAKRRLLLLILGYTVCLLALWRGLGRAPRPNRLRLRIPLRDPQLDRK